MKDFDYSRLPFATLRRMYAEGASWRDLAVYAGAPDHKTVKAWMLQRYPGMVVRSHAQSQRVRREREAQRRGG